MAIAIMAVDLAIVNSSDAGLKAAVLADTVLIAEALDRFLSSNSISLRR